MENENITVSGPETVKKQFAELQNSLEIIFSSAVTKAADIKADAESEYKAIIADANAKAEQIIADAKNTADEIVNEANRKAEEAEETAKSNIRSYFAEGKKRYDAIRANLTDITDLLANFGVQVDETVKRSDEMRDSLPAFPEVEEEECFKPAEKPEDTKRIAAEEVEEALERADTEPEEETTAFASPVDEFDSDDAEEAQQRLEDFDADDFSDSDFETGELADLEDFDDEDNGDDDDEPIIFFDKEEPGDPLGKNLSRRLDELNELNDRKLDF